VRSSLLSLFLLLNLFRAEAQSVTGNGGNGDSLYRFYATKYLKKLKPLAPTLSTTLDFNLVVFTPEQMLEIEWFPSSKSSNGRVCEDFFAEAYGAWQDFVALNEASNAFELSKINDSMTLEQLVYWQSFLKQDFNFLCSNKRFSRGFVSSVSKEPFVAANFQTKFKIIFNDLFVPVDASFFCARFAGHGDFYNQCPDVFNKSIALHEVLSLVLPKFEGSYRYEVTSFYLSYKVHEFSRPKLATVE